MKHSIKFNDVEIDTVTSSPQAMTAIHYVTG